VVAELVTVPGWYALVWVALTVSVGTLCYLAGWLAYYRREALHRRATALVSQSQTECLFEIAARLGLADYDQAGELRARLAALRERLEEHA